jgi:hypothetical protein
MTTAEPGRVPDPKILHDIWMRWEKAETAPGKTLSDLKAKGLRDLLEALVAAQEDATG